MMEKEMSRKQKIAYLSRFNIATYHEMNTWTDNRLDASIQFIKRELGRVKG